LKPNLTYPYQTVFCRSDVAQDGAKEAGGEENGVSKASSKAKKPSTFFLSTLFIQWIFDLRFIL
jgi:hypothetical protein